MQDIWRISDGNGLEMAVPVFRTVTSVISEFLLRKPRDCAKTELGIFLRTWVSITNSDAVCCIGVRYAGHSGLQCWGTVLHVGGIKWIPQVKSILNSENACLFLSLESLSSCLFVCYAPNSVAWRFTYIGRCAFWIFTGLDWDFCNLTRNLRTFVGIIHPLCRESLLPNLLHFVVCQPFDRSTPYNISYWWHFQAHLTIIIRQQGVPFKIIQPNFLHYMRNSITAHSV